MGIVERKIDVRENVLVDKLLGGEDFHELQQTPVPVKIAFSLTFYYNLFGLLIKLKNRAFDGFMLDSPFAQSDVIL